MIQIADDSTLENFLKDKKKVIVKFHADWCGVCKAFAPQFKQIAEEASSDITFIEINAPENPKARLAAGVYSLPFFASFTNGELVDKISSSDKNKILEMVDKIQKSSVAA